ncbi:MAG: ATP-binding cassette domain-containing protein [Aestuariibacter sp.]
MIKFENMSLFRGTKALFEHVNAQIHAGQKLGIIGRNGCGKSSLFALLQGQLSSETGDCYLPPEWRIASVAQHTPSTSQSALQYVIDGHIQFRQIEAQYHQALAEDKGILAAELHGKLQDLGADTIEARAGSILSGLGFDIAQITLPVNSFSGGWRMRLNLAQALLLDADLMLLDEPTNHLDLDAVIWLERWLASFRGTLLLISHDREFLDAVTQYTVSFELGSLVIYNGNYSSFERQQIEKLRQQDIAHQKQQEKKAHLQKFIDRFGAKASKAKQANARKKQLEKLLEVLPAHQESAFSFSFSAPESLPNPLINMDKLSAGYESSVILENIKLNLVPGSRIGILGKNGAGKSTLLKTIAGILPPIAGECHIAKGLRVGYFHQHQLEQLDPLASPLLHLQRLDSQAKEQALRDFLGSFQFQGDKALEPVAPMSGGEKARLALAMIVYQRPNLLILDEPTNHLDMVTRDALNLALQEFSGAMLLVSHDRFLVSAVCDEYYLVADRRVGPFSGDMQDYQTWVLTKDRQEKTTTEQQNSLSRKDLKRLQAEFRKQQQPVKKAVEQAEAQMQRLHQQISENDAQLADPVIYEEQSKAKLKALIAQQAEFKTALEETELRWLELTEQLEEAKAQFEREQNA